MASLKEYSKFRLKRSNAEYSHLPVENLNNFQRLSDTDWYRSIRKVEFHIIDSFSEIVFHLLFINIVFCCAIIIAELTSWVILQFRRLYYGHW